MTWVFWLSWSGRAILIWISFNQGWSQLTVVVLSIVLLLDFMRYGAFRKFRTKIPQEEKLPFYLRVRNNTTYALQQAIIGCVALVVICYAHLYFFRVNVLVLIMCYLHVIYGLIIVPIKILLYHKYRIRNNKPHPLSKFYMYSISFVPFVLALWMLYSATRGNDLHLLPMTPQEEQVIGIDEYVDELSAHFAKRDTFYFISAYGGGLKANAWNMLLLDTLSDFYGKNILENTVAMSGVSGGSLGQTLYTAIYKNHKEDRALRKRIIDSISSADILSIDATYFLGKDFIREFSPRKHTPFAPDRSAVAMKHYSNMVGDPSMYDKTYQEYWCELFEDQRADSSFYPLLLSNSAGIHIQRGIASTVDFGDKFYSVFHDAIDILEHGTKSIPYIYAASCSNRFPVFSPAAKVKNKGHFVDGGYFENSGLSALLDVYDYLKSYPIFKAGKTVIFVQVLNGKSDYVKFRTLQEDLDSKKINESGEISAIVNTAMSIDMLPRYLVKRMEQNRDSIKFIQLHLPYPYHLEDVENQYKGKIRKEELKASIAQHNEDLENKLRICEPHEKYDFIEPPLARILGPQAYNYMKAMVKYSGIDSLGN